MIALTKNEILFQLKALGINSASELSLYQSEYSKYHEKNAGEHGNPFKKDIYQKRAHGRVPVNIKIKYIHQRWGYRKNLYTGIIKNLSEKGMFISTNNYFHPKSKVELSIPVKKTFLGISIKKQFICIPANNISIVWKGLSPCNTYDGIGIELLNPTQCYLEFVDRFRSIHKS